MISYIYDSLGSLPAWQRFVRGSFWVRGGFAGPKSGFVRERYLFVLLKVCGFVGDFRGCGVAGGAGWGGDGAHVGYYR